MKRSLLFFFCFILNTISYADAWDNMTLDEAQKVADYIRKNPFIIDYCDGCDYQGEYAARVFLLQVLNTEIVTCEWNTSYYSVKANVVKVAEITFTKGGLNTDKLMKADPYPYEYMIYMNYTYVFNWNNRRAVALMDVIPYSLYDGNRAPSGYSEPFPDPVKSKKIIKNTAYIQWYERRVRQ